jgi:hypothetical protein
MVVNKVKKKLDLMQKTQFSPDNVDSQFKVNKIMGIDLEILWSRYGRFQLLILSIMMSCISWIFKLVMLKLLSDEYKDSYNCTLIFPLAHNRTRPDDTRVIIKVMASISELINFFLQDFFPVFFILLTLDETTSK